MAAGDPTLQQQAAANDDTFWYAFDEAFMSAVIDERPTIPGS